MKINEKKIINLIREEYSRRLLELEIGARISEAEVIDKRGNLLIAKDLKVKHKDSGYEYTVDRIEGEDDNMIIYLRKPDVPRIEPAIATKTITEDENPVKKGTKKEKSTTDEQADVGNETFAISAEEFDREYVVD